MESAIILNIDQSKCNSRAGPWVTQATRCLLGQNGEGTLSVCVHLDRIFQTPKRQETGLYCLCVYTLTPACYLLAAVSGSWLPEERCSVSATVPHCVPSLLQGSCPFPLEMANLGAAEDQVRSARATGAESIRGCDCQRKDADRWL